MFEKTLPIGSVVKSKAGKKNIMIVGYYQCKAGDTNKIYDYVGVAFPEGFLSGDQLALFDHSEIEHILYLGFQDEERYAFEEKLAEAIKISDQQNGRA